jgi:hypothetical protein
MALRNAQGQREKYLTLELSSTSNPVEDMCAIVSKFQSAKIGDDEGSWPEEPVAPQSPELASQPLARGLPLHCSGTAQACPQCGANSWYQRLTYRLCQRCQYKDGLTPQEIREHQ